MSEITRGQIVRVGADLAKRVIHVLAVDAGGRVVVSRQLPERSSWAGARSCPLGAW
jgi:hypothetical protein